MTLDSHFKKKPEIREIFDFLVEMLENFGPVSVTSFETLETFAPDGGYIPGLNKAFIFVSTTYRFFDVIVSKRSLKLSFRSEMEIVSERIAKASSGRKNIYVVKINKKSDIDEELLAWLKKHLNFKSETEFLTKKNE